MNNTPLTSNDLLDRLRFPGSEAELSAAATEAADEIVRLQRQVETLSAELAKWTTEAQREKDRRNAQPPPSGSPVPKVDWEIATDALREIAGYVGADESFDLTAREMRSTARDALSVIESNERLRAAETKSALCPHGLPLADNVCGPCSEGRPNRAAGEPPSSLRDLLTEFGQAYLKLCTEGSEHQPRVEAAERAIHAHCTASPPPAPQWISVDDRLPELDARVLYAFNGYTWQGSYRGLNDGLPCFAGPHGFISGDATHWMPLPEPPGAPLTKESPYVMRPSEEAAMFKAVTQRPVETSAVCGCWDCSSPERRMTTFIVCPDCGNKRCPRATSHLNACTGSNEPGQLGSRFTPAGLSESETASIADKGG
jgi:hypothetical protein